MSSSTPSEYISLIAGQAENFAEIYDKRLKNPHECKYGPRYNSFCPFCSDKTVENHGMTAFSKVRLNISTLTIVEEDFTFAKLIYGTFVAFGTAGDCYSLDSNCLQVLFEINIQNN